MIYGPDAAATAQWRARYSRYDWIVWHDHAGHAHADRLSAASIKMAMRASGTQRRFVRYERRTGSAMLITWRSANSIRRQWLRGLHD